MIYKGYQLDFNSQKLLGSRGDIYKLLGVSRARCSECGRYYRLPSSVFEPRDRICASCEDYLRKLILAGVIKNESPIIQSRI